VLAADYLVEPYVSVVIREYANYSIIGQVSKPGSYELSPGLTLSEAIAHAGGFVRDADTSNVELIRHGRGEQKTTFVVDVLKVLKSNNKENDFLLQPEDMIVIGGLKELDPEEKEYVYVLGQVRKPGKYQFEKGISVFTLISEAGGLTDIASANKTKIIRSKEGENATIRVPLGAILKGDITKDVELVPGDTVMVPESFF